MTRKQGFRALQELATEHGFTFDQRTRNGHYRWRHPGGGLVITGSSLDGPVSQRILKNIARDFRRASMKGTQHDLHP